LDVRKRRGRLPVAAAIALVGVLAVLAACAPPSPAASPLSPLAAPTGPFDLVVVHSNDTWGYLDPCG
jgi:hypothetical protein